MKAHYKTRSGRLTIEVEGQTIKELFRGIAEVEGIMDGDAVCGCCNGQKIQHRVRSTQKGDYYELFCTDCTAALTFSQYRDGGGLFLKRRDDDGKPLQNGGWKIWRPAASTAAPVAVAAGGDIPDF